MQQRTKESAKKAFMLAVIPVIVAAMLVPAFTHNTEPQAAAETNAKTVQIRIVGSDDVQFAPSRVSIKVGDEVTFINVDGYNGGVQHWVLSIDGVSGIPDGVFNSGMMKVGDTYTVKFNTHGVYTFIDGIYPATNGYIIVD
jgi:plastocyanin